MGKELNFQSITTFLSKIDEWNLNNFGISSSLADNIEQIAVILIAFTILSILLVLTTGKNKQKNNTLNADSKETKEHKTPPALAKSQPTASASDSLKRKSNEAETVTDITHPINLENDNEVSNSLNVFELENGFVINKRRADTREIDKTEVNIEEKELGLAVNAANDKKLNLADALSKIEAEMIGIRKEYKSGNISSMDYLSKTQDLYKKGEKLMGSEQSFNA